MVKINNISPFRGGTYAQHVAFHLVLCQKGVHVCLSTLPPLKIRYIDFSQNSDSQAALRNNYASTTSPIDVNVKNVKFHFKKSQNSMNTNQNFCEDHWENPFKRALDCGCILFLCSSTHNNGRSGINVLNASWSIYVEMKYVWLFSKRQRPIPSTWEK